MTNEYESTFEFRETDYSNKKAYLQWSTVKNDADYFNPSEKEFMINYRLHDIEALVAELKANGVTFLDEIDTYDYGKFVHLLDPESHKIELWKRK